MKELTEVKLVEKVTIVGYESVDGKVFESQSRCKKYEEMLDVAYKLNEELSFIESGFKVVEYKDYFFFACMIKEKEIFNLLRTYLLKNSSVKCLDKIDDWEGPDIYFFRRLTDNINYTVFVMHSKNKELEELNELKEELMNIEVNTNKKEENYDFF